MRVLIEEVFRKNNIEINKENKNRFMKWWSISEIKKWQEYILDGYEEEKKFFLESF